MKKWEYMVKVFSLNISRIEMAEELDKLGAAGWEVVTMSSNNEGGLIVILKRCDKSAVG